MSASTTPSDDRQLAALREQAERVLDGKTGPQIRAWAMETFGRLAPTHDREELARVFAFAGLSVRTGELGEPAAQPGKPDVQTEPHPDMAPGVLHLSHEQAGSELMLAGRKLRVMAPTVHSMMVPMARDGVYTHQQPFEVASGAKHEIVPDWNTFTPEDATKLALDVRPTLGGMDELAAEGSVKRPQLSGHDGPAKL